jgi:hypothetical protein
VADLTSRFGGVGRGRELRQQPRQFGCGVDFSLVHGLLRGGARVAALGIAD